MKVENTFIECCENGLLNEAKKFYNNNISVYSLQYSFRMACANGHLKVAQWLLSVKPDINISADDEYAFRWACKKSHLEVAQWLLSVKPDINISIYNEYVFRYACSAGHLQVAQWLLSVKPDINISVYSEEAFSNACYHNHLEVVQWLLSVKPDIDISVDDEFAFCYACENGHLEVAQWLQTLKPYLYVIYYNKDGFYKDYYIRTKEEENFEKKKYALWLTSKNSPNKESIFYKIPSDLSKDIIKNYI